MTPPATAARSGHRTGKLRRAPAPRSPRRVSGPSRPPRAALAGAGGAAVARPPLSLRLGRRAMRVGDARVLDRLVRGRAWIAIVAAALIGIVFMQVSMLKLNAGVSRAVTAADTLERQNSTLRADISELDSGERVQDAAAKLGMTTRPAGDVRYLDAERASAGRAAASIKPPNPVALAPAANGTGAAASGTAAAATTSGATATGAAAATTSGATATGAAAATTSAATAAGAAATSGTTGAATTSGATATGAAASGAAPSGSQSGAAQNGAAATSGTTGAASPTAQQTAPPATGTTNQAGSVAGGATATPGEG